MLQIYRYLSLRFPNFKTKFYKSPFFYLAKSPGTIPHVNTIARPRAPKRIRAGTYLKHQKNSSTVQIITTLSKASITAALPMSFARWISR